MNGWGPAFHLSSCAVFDTKTQSWSAIPAMPSARVDHVSAFINNKLYVVGLGGISFDWPLRLIAEMETFMKVVLVESSRIYYVFLVNFILFSLFLFYCVTLFSHSCVHITAELKLYIFASVLSESLFIQNKNTLQWSIFREVESPVVCTRTLCTCSIQTLKLGHKWRQWIIIGLMFDHNHMINKNSPDHSYLNSYRLI